MRDDDKPTFFDDLDATRTHAWALLARGVADRRSGFHTPTLVTVSLDSAPDARTVVLRACNVQERTLRFHTDARSGKVAEIAREPRVLVHAYDFKSKAQIRLEGRARVMDATSDVARTAWAASHEMSRLCYAQACPPGAPIEAPELGELRDADGERNFNVILVEITAFEWLYLFHAGHRRARFEWTSGEWRGRWLAP